MSFYNSSVQTRLLDPVYDIANQRTEWRLNSDTCYLSNLRILNIGVVGAATAVGNTYNRLVGALGVLKNIRIYDGNQQLDSINDINRWLAFKNLLKSNSLCSNMNNVLSKNALGYHYVGIDTTTKTSRLEAFQPSGAVTNADATSVSAWLSLKDLFPFLDSALHLPTNVFKNIRIVIEWETDADMFVKTNDSTYTTKKPVLVADELANSPTKSQLMKSFKGVSYVGLENDRVVVSALTPTGGDLNPEQKINAQVGGFTNKRVNRMVIMKTPTSASSYKAGDVNDNFGKIASVQQVAENYQIRVNGSDLYPESGITKPNEILGRCQDAWGVQDTPLGAYMPDPAAIPEFDGAGSVLGHQNYIGVNLAGERVGDLQITYGRKGQFDTAGGDQTGYNFNQQLVLNIVAEVQKQISVAGADKYVISYV